MSGGDLRVTVVVPVRDSGDLPALVEALRAQSLGTSRFEVVVADDGSAEPPAVAADGEWLRVDSAPAVNSYAARNRGARLARGEVLAFVDADCLPEPGWLEHGLAAVDAGASLAAGEVRPEPPRRLTAWALLDADDCLNQRRAVAERHAVTANLFVRRDAFERLHGFDERLPSGGDYELVERAVAAGERLVLAADAVVGHPTLDRARPFLRRAWFRDRSHAVRKGPQAAVRLAPQLAKLIPLAGPLWARARLGRPLGLDRSRLAWGDLRPRRRTIAAALALRYLVLPYVSAAAYLPLRRGRPS